MTSAINDQGSGKPLRRLPRPRLLSALLALAGIGVIVAGFFLKGSTPFVDPSPPEGYGPPIASSGDGTATPAPLGSGADGGLLPDASHGAAPAHQPGSDRPAAEPPPGVPVSSGRLEDLPTREQAQPVRLLIPALGVDAPIRPVGVSDGEMEVPPTADLVAWYRFGPAPGERGSAVLAAHVSWGGRLGVFYRLRDLPPGTEIEVQFADGSARRFRSVELAAYDKSDLPADRIFRQDTEPVLTLVTCGGAFNESLRRFEQNVVAYAVPIGPPTGTRGETAGPS